MDYQRSTLPLRLRRNYLFGDLDYVMNEMLADVAYITPEHIYETYRQELQCDLQEELNTLCLDLFEQVEALFPDIYMVVREAEQPGFVRRTIINRPAAQHAIMDVPNASISHSPSSSASAYQRQIPRRILSIESPSKTEVGEERVQTGSHPGSSSLKVEELMDGEEHSRGKDEGVNVTPGKGQQSAEYWSARNSEDEEPMVECDDIVSLSSATGSGHDKERSRVNSGPLEGSGSHGPGGVMHKSSVNNSGTGLDECLRMLNLELHPPSKLDVITDEDRAKAMEALNMGTASNGAIHAGKSSSSSVDLDQKAKTNGIRKIAPSSSRLMEQLTDADRAIFLQGMSSLGIAFGNGSPATGVPSNGGESKQQPQQHEFPWEPSEKSGSGNSQPGQSGTHAASQAPPNIEPSLPAADDFISDLNAPAGVIEWGSPQDQGPLATIVEDSLSSISPPPGLLDYAAGAQPQQADARAFQPEFQEQVPCSSSLPSSSSPSPYSPSWVRQLSTSTSTHPPQFAVPFAFNMVSSFPPHFQEDQMQVLNNMGQQPMTTPAPTMPGPQQQQALPLAAISSQFMPFFPMQASNRLQPHPPPGRFFPPFNYGGQQQSVSAHFRYPWNPNGMLPSMGGMLPPPWVFPSAANRMPTPWPQPPFPLRSAFPSFFMPPHFRPTLQREQQIFSNPQVGHRMRQAYLHHRRAHLASILAEVDRMGCQPGVAATDHFLAEYRREIVGLLQQAEAECGQAGVAPLLYPAHTSTFRQEEGAGEPVTNGSGTDAAMQYPFGETLNPYPPVTDEKDCIAEELSSEGDSLESAARIVQLGEMREDPAGNADEEGEEHEEWSAPEGQGVGQGNTQLLEQGIPRMSLSKVLTCEQEKKLHSALHGFLSTPITATRGSSSSSSVSYSRTGSKEHVESSSSNGSSGARIEVSTSRESNQPSRVQRNEAILLVDTTGEDNLSGWQGNGGTGAGTTATQPFRNPSAESTRPTRMPEPQSTVDFKRPKASTPALSPQLYEEDLSDTLQKGLNLVVTLPLPGRLVSEMQMRLSPRRHSSPPRGLVRPFGEEEFPPQQSTPPPSAKSDGYPYPAGPPPGFTSPLAVANAGPHPPGFTPPKAQEKSGAKNELPVSDETKRAVGWEREPAARRGEMAEMDSANGDCDDEDDELCSESSGEMIVIDEC